MATRTLIGASACTSILFNGVSGTLTDKGFKSPTLTSCGIKGDTIVCEGQNSTIINGTTVKGVYTDGSVTMKTVYKKNRIENAVIIGGNGNHIGHIGHTEHSRDSKSTTVTTKYYVPNFLEYILGIFDRFKFETTDEKTPDETNSASEWKFDESPEFSEISTLGRSKVDVRNCTSNIVSLNVTGSGALTVEKPVFSHVGAHVVGCGNIEINSDTIHKANAEVVGSGRIKFHGDVECVESSDVVGSGSIVFLKSSNRISQRW